MIAARCFAIAIAIVELGACDKGGGGSSPSTGTSVPERASGVRRRRNRGQRWSADPRPQPTVAEILKTTAWVPVVIQGNAPMMSLHWIDGDDDLAAGRLAIKLRRAAFGARTVPPQSAAPIDERTLDDTDLDHGPSGLLLVGPGGTCIGKAEVPVVVQRDRFGRLVEVLRSLSGCRGKDWAPLGMLSPLVPKLMRWQAMPCADDERTQAIAGEIARIGTLERPPASAGRFVLADEVMAFVFADEARWWVAVPDGDHEPTVIAITDLGAEAPACAAPPAEPVPAEASAEPDPL